MVCPRFPRFPEDERKLAETAANASWPNAVKGFQGPGDLGDIAIAALTYLRNNGADSDGEILAMRITSDWTGCEPDVDGRFTAWCLSFVIAQPAEGRDGFARVSQGNLVTLSDVAEPRFSRWSISSSNFLVDVTKVKP